MNIGSYNLTSAEENKVFAIYEKLKRSFPDIRIDQRKEIVGIGEEGRRLVCYFSLRDGAVSVKFKNKAWLNLNDSESIESDMESAIELFKTEELKIKKNSHTGERKNHARAEARSDDTYEYVRWYFARFEKALESVPQSKADMSFTSCSTRLKNALYSNDIFKVRDLFAFSPLQIRNIHNIGKGSFLELCDFLLALSGNENAIYDNDALHVKIQTEENFQKLKYINDNRREIPVNVNDATMDLAENAELYSALYSELAKHIYETAQIRLRPRECAILLSRFGINESAKTLQEIGEAHSITRERVRQILLKAMRKMGNGYTRTDELLDLECRKIDILSRISELSAGKFLSFLFCQEVSPSFIQFFCHSYLHSEIDVEKFKEALHKKSLTKNRQDKNTEKSRLYNDNVNRLIVFPSKKRRITDDDFARLKSERIVKTERGDLIHCSFDSQTYACDSYSEERVLRKFLANYTFKKIKTKSLKIPFQDSFFIPDFQCLTHDNFFVIIEMKPLLKMCEYKSIKRFEALKNYCKKYGFGYLIIDERGNSFEHIDEQNENFSKAILAEIDKSGRITYPKYKEIYSQTNATIKNFITLIKKHSLHFSFPFLLEK